MNPQHLSSEMSPLKRSVMGDLLSLATAPDILSLADERKVIYVPGAAFAVEGGFQNTMRLNFSDANSEKLREAVRRLTQVIESELKVKEGH